ncbi:HPr-rel-A system PqqD family peptide chaperone [Crenothrix sp.]|uniref:HPr-rel-A system PqqD family peptide chaperone n=1 Tax=Crenothrix sp. TaxID=3100433 RepID=UPI00374D223D
MNESTRWQSVNHIETYSTQGDDDTIVYNPLSGETHQLNLMAIDALNFMQQPANLQSLTDHICLLYQSPNTDEINQQMRQLVEQFDDLGLITVCWP